MDIKETERLELKAQVTRTFLKTVSAYANYKDGEILFGVDDNGNVSGIENPKEEALRVENMINDSLQPAPQYAISEKIIGDKRIISLMVKKGKETPYFYQGKAYKRSAAATVEVDRFELRRLAMDGLNMDYEGRKAAQQDLQFTVLEASLRDAVGVEKLSLDILKTLALYNKDGYYNVAGELLADRNDISFSGVDIARFGKSINQIMYRETVSKQSLLTQFRRALAIFEQYYIFEEIEGYSRVQRELIPRESYREALANAIVHRVWDINAYVQIAMHEDRVEIRSPGGLPAGLTKEEYLQGNISVLRNPIIAGVFHRLHMIEKFGTGIARINALYVDSVVKPSFDVSENSIKIVLPVTRAESSWLCKDEQLVYDVLQEGVALSRQEIDAEIELGKAKTIRVLNRLLAKNIIKKAGRGARVTYKLNR